MDIQNLVKMANQIGDFFESMPDREEATHEIALHLKKFWAPAMRRELLGHVDGNTEPGLKAIVLNAIRIHRNEIQPGT